MNNTKFANREFQLKFNNSSSGNPNIDFITPIIAFVNIIKGVLTKINLVD